MPWCDAHHVIPYARGGGTTLTNLVLKCRRHHTLVHHPGWTEVLDPDGTLHLTDPFGHVHTSHPPAPGRREARHDRGMVTIALVVVILVAIVIAAASQRGRRR